MALFERNRRSRGKIVWGARGSLTASAVASRRTDSEESPYVRLHQPWQAKVFSYYNRMGECYNPAQFVAKALSKVRLYAATGTRDDPEELTSGWAADLVANWASIPEPYGRLKALIGEGRLCQSVSPLDSERGVVWEFLSPVELKKTESGGKLVRRIGSTDVEYEDISEQGGGDPEPGQMRMWRFWNPHPENSGYADSAFRATLDLYEQLWWITLAERAELRNRVANQGILLVPEEIEFTTPGADEEAMDDDPEVDPFNEILQRVMTAALADPGGAAAAAPAVIRAQAEFLKPDVFRHIKFHDPQSSVFVSNREDALLRRISIGLNMPVEEIMGLSQANHWTAWKIDDEKFQYVYPEISRLEEDLTEAVLRPIGRASEQPDADAVFVVADFAKLVSDPDRGKTAIELRKVNAVSNEYVREANDVPEESAPDEQDHLEWLAIQLRDPSVAGFETAAPEGGSPPADEEPVSETEEPPEDDTTDGDPDLARRLHVAAALAARASAGTWLRSKRRSCPECFEGIPAEADLVASLDRSSLRKLGTNEVEVACRMRDAFIRGMAMFGHPVDVALAPEIEAFFSETLFEPRDPPVFGANGDGRG